MQTFDIIIVGAGINGCALAYSLKKRGQNVLVLESDEIASGGSGAAGAFINPKISKSGPLKELIEKAYLYGLTFYHEHFEEQTTLAPLLHIAKYEDENEKVDYFKAHTSLQTAEVPARLAASLTAYANSFSSVYIKNNAIVEAREVCQKMLEGIACKTLKVNTPKYEEGLWHVGAYKAKRMILCTGGSQEVFKEPYIKLRRIYGQRCEVESSTSLSATVHHEVSISATKKNGRIVIGASHYLEKEMMPKKEEGEAALINLAQKSVVLEDVKVCGSYSGMRSGSNDYLPIIGPLVKASDSIKKSPQLLKGDKEADLEYYPELYMINGVGGYGFVLAPYLSKLMTDYLLDAEALPEYLAPKRFFYRWAKKEAAL